MTEEILKAYRTRENQREQTTVSLKQREKKLKEGKKEKISEMVAHFMREYLALGEDMEHKQQLLNIAVSAWNIASLNEQKREEAIKKISGGWKKLNPTHGKIC